MLTTQETRDFLIYKVGGFRISDMVEWMENHLKGIPENEQSEIDLFLLFEQAWKNEYQYLKRKKEYRYYLKQVERRFADWLYTERNTV